MSQELPQHFAAPNHPELAGAALAALEQMCRAVVRRRGIVRPRWVGVASDEWTEEAWSDFVQAAYMDLWKTFRVRVAEGSLHDQHIRNRLHQWVFRRQRKANPLGYNAFKNIEAAVELAEREGWLVVQRHGDRLTNRAVLHHPDASPGDLADDEEVQAVLGGSEALRLAALAQEQCSETGRTAALAVLELLLEAGLGCFRLGTVLGRLKTEARAILSTAAERTGLSVAMDEDGPVLAVEAALSVALGRVAAQQLNLRVNDALARVRNPVRRDRLEHLWKRLYAAAITGEPIAPPDPTFVPRGRATAHEDRQTLLTLILELDPNAFDESVLSSQSGGRND